MSSSVMRTTRYFLAAFPNLTRRPHYYSLCHPPSLLVPLQSVYGRPITNNFHMNKAHLTILVSMLPTRTATQSSRYAGEPAEGCCVCDWIVSHLPCPEKYVEWPVMRRMGGWRATVNSVMKLKHDFAFPRVKGHVDG